MKTSINFVLLSVALICFITLTYSAPYNLVLDNTNTSQSLNETVLDFQLSEYRVSSVVINNEEHNYISVNDASVLREKGFPALPLISQSIIIPNDAAMGIEILDAHYTEVSVKKIAPSKGPIFRNQNPLEIPYTFNEIYAKDTWYPEKAVSLGDPYIIRDMRGLVVTFFPIQYNPARGVVRVIDNISVKIKRIGEGKINVLKTPKAFTSLEFVKAYGKRFINFSLTRSLYTPVKDGDKMIVICALDFKSELQKLVEWKNTKGIKTDLYEYPSQTGNGANSIKSFIQNKYNDDKFTYLLLVRDHEDLPSLESSRETSDPSYLLLAGNDKYPDVFGGRFSVSNTTEAQTLVNKVVSYEKEPEANGAWYHKAMGVASNDGGWSGATDREHMDRYRTKLRNYNYTEIDQIYDPGADKDDVINGLNDGRGWVNYMGHGMKNDWSTTGFSSSDMSRLSNGSMTPVIISVACINGDFEGGTCFAEEFIRAKDGGAVAFMGSTIFQAWVPPQKAMAEMVDLLVADTYISIGGIIYNGEMKMLEAGNDQNTFKTWTLFGDPSLHAFTDTPKEMQVTHPNSITSGQQNMDISFGTKIKGRACIYSEDNGILASKIVDDASAVKLSVTITNETEVLLTVTALNKMPYQKKIGDTSPIKTGKQKISHYALTCNNSTLFYQVPHTIANNAQVSIKLFNPQGKLIHTLVDANKTGGVYRVNLQNATNVSAAGVFFAKMIAGDFSKTIRIVKK